MDDLPVGNPKYSRIRATYYQAHRPTQDPPDSWRDDLAAVIVGILVLIVIFLMAQAGATPSQH